MEKSLETSQITNSIIKKISTARFGEIEFTEKDLVIFPRGLLGFEKLRKYILIEREVSKPFIWLQSVQMPSVAFPIVDPLFFNPDYVIEVQVNELLEIGLTDHANARTFVIATVPHGKPQEISINLLGPIIINVENRRASQIALTESGYPTKFFLNVCDEKHPEEVNLPIMSEAPYKMANP